VLRRLFILLLLAGLASTGTPSARSVRNEMEAADAQSRRTRRAPVKPAATNVKRENASIKCPAVLGQGVKTARLFCDVLAGKDPSAGIVVQVPPHTGSATLMFDLHNRHRYSAEITDPAEVFVRYTATIGVLTLKSDLLRRAIVQSEFRGVSDLLDRVAGGADPGNVKAVAPLGIEPVVVTIPANVVEVSILGEKLEMSRTRGAQVYSSPGGPVATVSNVVLEYRPRKR
jgi:hypothetical protein